MSFLVRRVPQTLDGTTSVPFRRHHSGQSEVTSVQSVKRALVTGAAGQDGIYLARRLRAAGKAVTGVVSPTGSGAERVATYVDGVEVVSLDLRDTGGLRALVADVDPDEVYNLAAVSSVGRSWSEPELTFAVNATAVEVLVEALVAQQRRTGRAVRVFQASTAETSKGAAESPYARAKAVAEDVVRSARDEQDLHGCIAQLHIHESPLRAATFVTRKITRGAAAIASGRADHLTLGNLDVVRDWGFADDYMDAVHRLMNLDQPADLPIGTGIPHTLEELVSVAFAAAGLEAAGEYVVQDPELVRPADTPVLVADPEPAERLLGWRATTGLEELIGAMVEIDLERLRTGVEDDRRYLAASPRV